MYENYSCDELKGMKRSYQMERRDLSDRIDRLVSNRHNTMLDYRSTRDRLDIEFEDITTKLINIENEIDSRRC